MEIYNSDKWHPNSIEYYKLTEHYISYKLNIKNGKTKKYYEPSIEKYKIAKEYARKNIRELYAENTKKLMD
jgi:hypothetical protein